MGLYPVYDADFKEISMADENKAPEVDTNKAPKKVAHKSSVPAVEKKIGTNALTLPWPADPQGALAELKRGGIKAAKRVNGDKVRMKKLMETCEIIIEHAKARYVVDVKARREAKENAAGARARIADNRAKAAEAKAEEYEAAAARLRKEAGIVPETQKD